ncbi:uncharacterized protein [Nicotiana tomentosiformis]|uniref:uncharacterized protein n=1 Tax=Nicotiana tomentosiformis TaxID=4098 RepID=UPI00388C57A0
MKAFILKTDERLETHSAAIREHGASIKEQGTGFRNLERQVGQYATLLSERISGTLPADTERNPKETMNVVTMRSGFEKESGEQLESEVDKKKKGQMKAEKKKKDENSIREEREESKNALTNACLCQILEGDPYKEEEDRRDHSGQAHKHCSAILQNKLPQKCGDPASFTIPCSLGTINFDKSLCDSGSSINLMPLSIYRKLEKEIGEIRSAPISLQLVDQTTIIPEGIMEDVLVRVDKFVFPVDFIVVNMEENKEAPLILGRPFLVTGKVILDIHERKLMLRVGEETMTFEMNVVKGTQKDKPVASVELKVKGSKEKVAVSEKDKCGVYPKKAEKKLSAWMCTLVRARVIEPDFDSNLD